MVVQCYGRPTRERNHMVNNRILLPNAIELQLSYLTEKT